MSTLPRSADKLVDILLNVPGMLDQVRNDPENTLRKLAEQTTKQLPPPPTVSHAGIYYVVVISLGVVAVASIIGAIILAANTSNGEVIKIPDVLTALGSAAIGALAGLLSPSPKTD